MRKVDNDKLARIVLRCLYAKPIGVDTPNIAALKSLCSPKLNGIEVQLLTNIVAGSPAGLRGRGYVTCKPGGVQGHLFEALDIELTDEGRAWVEQHAPQRPLRRAGAWLLELVAAAVVTGVIGGLVGWFLRGWLKP